MEHKKRILITGSTGFIGRNFVKATEDIFDFFYLTRDEQDLREKLRADLPEDIDVIVHLAHADKQADRAELVDINVQATFQLLEYGVEAKIKKFLYISTGNVYGFHKDVVKESVCLNPAELYGATKAAAELLCWQYKSNYEVNILRLFSPYGPDQQLSRLIPTLIQKIMQDEPITINNKVGNPITNPIYISDVVEVLKRTVLHNGSFKLNVGGKEPQSILQLAQCIGKHTGKEIKYNHIVNERMGDIAGDVSCMEKTLKYSPSVDVEQGIKECLKSYS